MIPIAAAAGDERANSAARRPWEWSDSERLVERSNDAAAARRAARYTADLHGVYDFIDGSREPHLFFEYELFDHMMLAAYTDDTRTREVYRETKEDIRRSLGLPDDFWDRVGAIAAAYRKDRLEERRLGLATTRSPRHEAEEQAVMRQLCRDRWDALAALRREFPRFREFLYTAIGASMTSTIFRKGEDGLRAVVLTGECR